MSRLSMNTMSRPPARADGEAAVDGRVAEQRLEEEREHRGGAVEAHAERADEPDADGEVPVAEDAQVHDRLGDQELADDERDHGEGGDRDEPAHPRRGEPVDLLAAVEHDLGGGEPQGHQAEADVVDAALPPRPDVRRILDDGVDEEGGQDADREVDEEDPAPGVVVGDPPAEGRAEDRRHDDAHGKRRHGRAPPGGLEALHEDRLRDRLEGPAAQPLEDPRHDQHAEAGGPSAEGGGQREEARADHQDALASEPVAEPGGDGEDRRVGQEVAREHPGGLLGRRREAAADVRQGHRDDGGVEHLHEGAEHHGERDQPRVEARRPFAAGSARLPVPLRHRPSPGSPRI
jgi:hypothetical protein